MEIHFEIENKCLLKCRHCSSCASSCGQKMDYAVSDMVSFLNKLKGTKEIYLTGGEPLLYPEIVVLLKHLPISEEYAEQLACSGLKVCYLSVYSCIKEEHDWMTNVEGAFDLTRVSISHLKKAGIDVRFNSVITSRNQGQLPELIEMAKVYGATEVRLLKLINHGRAEACWDIIGINEDQYRYAVMTILQRENPVRITASGVVDLISCRPFCGKDTCPAGKQLWYITYCGDIYPCASVKNQMHYKVGNIKDDIDTAREGFHKLLDGEVLCK